MIENIVKGRTYKQIINGEERFYVVVEENPEKNYVTIRELKLGEMEDEDI